MDAKELNLTVNAKDFLAKPPTEGNAQRTGGPGRAWLFSLINEGHVQRMTKDEHKLRLGHVQIVPVTLILLQPEKRIATTTDCHTNR